MSVDQIQLMKLQNKLWTGKTIACHSVVLLIQGLPRKEQPKEGDQNISVIISYNVFQLMGSQTQFSLLLHLTKCEVHLEPGQTKCSSTGNHEHFSIYFLIYPPVRPSRQGNQSLHIIGDPAWIRFDFFFFQRCLNSIVSFKKDTAIILASEPLSSVIRLLYIVLQGIQPFIGKLY